MAIEAITGNPSNIGRSPSNNQSGSSKVVELPLEFSPAQASFVWSEEEIVALIGPQGEGKTFAGGARIICQAALRKARGGPVLRGAIIRDTGPNLRDHTIPSLQKAFGTISRFKSQGTSSWKWFGPHFEAVLFGIDSILDLSRLQGLEPDFIWLEEPAPIIQGSSNGLPEEVLTIGLSRLRGTLGYKWLQATMNPGEESHYTYRYFHEDPLPMTAVFHTPYGSNSHLSDEDRQRTVRAYTNRPDLARRYVKGEWGSVQVGEAVTPEYRPLTHRSSEPLLPLPKVKGYRFWDGWHNPACLIAQRTPRGHINILDVVAGENIGVRQFVNGIVAPLMADKYHRVTEWEDYGDETMRTPDQSDRGFTAAGAVEELLGTYFNPCMNLWEPRRESMKALLNTMIDGIPMVQLDPREKILHNALRGGWHYLKTPSGVVKDRPVKDMHSNPGDCFSYASVVLMPMPKKAVKIPNRGRKRAMSYAGR